LNIIGGYHHVNFIPKINSEIIWSEQFILINSDRYVGSQLSNQIQIYLTNSIHYIPNSELYEVHYMNNAFPQDHLFNMKVLLRKDCSYTASFNNRYYIPESLFLSVLSFNSYDIKFVADEDDLLFLFQQGFAYYSCKSNSESKKFIHFIYNIYKIELHSLTNIKVTFDKEIEVKRIFLHNSSIEKVL
jgi:hypothetical protein